MASAAVPPDWALAAERPKDTLVIVSEMGPNGLDTMVPTANDHSRMVNWQAYDRLVTHGEKTLADGTVSYDAKVMTPELAESWEVSDDGKTYVFHLRKDATFHDGTPVTAKDVKWSFDRAIAAGGFPAVQMAAGSLVKPEQFSVIDDHTFKATFEQFNKLTMPDLVVPVPAIVNSELAKKHATDKDPWAFDWVSHNDCGGGAFKIESWTPGQQTIFTRFDDWKSGPLPKLKRVIYKQIPSPGRAARCSRRAMSTCRSAFRRRITRNSPAGQSQGHRRARPERSRLRRYERQDCRPSTTRRCARRSRTRFPTRRSSSPRSTIAPSRCSAAIPHKPYPDGVWPVPLKHGQDLDEGQAAPHRGRLSQWLQDDALLRSQRSDGARADRHSDPGGAEEDRRRT